MSAHPHRRGNRQAGRLAKKKAERETESKRCQVSSALRLALVSGVRLCQRTFIISFSRSATNVDVAGNWKKGRNKGVAKAATVQRLCAAYYATEIEKLCLPARWG